MAEANGNPLWRRLTLFYASCNFYKYFINTVFDKENLSRFISRQDQIPLERHLKNAERKQPPSYNSIFVITSFSNKGDTNILFLLSIAV